MMQRLPDSLFYTFSPKKVGVFPATAESILRRHASMLRHGIIAAGDPLHRFGESLTYHAELPRNRTRLMLVRSNIRDNSIFERVADEIGCVPNTVSTNKGVVAINHTFLHRTAQKHGDVLELYAFSPEQEKMCQYDVLIQLQAQRLVQIIADALLIGQVMYCTSAVE